MKISGVGVALPLVLGPKVVEAAGEEVAVYGPGKVPITLTVNGKKLTAQLEPRVTLLDALRDNFDLTGAKRVCDRGACGACTVLMDGKPVYACAVLAIDAQGKNITTIEGLAEGDALTPVMQAFVAHDAQQCGFCTPGFIVATTKFPRAASESHDGGHPPRTERQLLPLWDLRRNSRRRFGQAGRESVMSEYQWPDPATRPLLGKRISRVDGPGESFRPREIHL